MAQGYAGVIVKSANEETDAVKEKRERRGREGEELEEEDEERGEELEEVDALEEVASFDNIVLWGHESLVEGDDPFVKGVEEWIGFAEAVSPAFLELRKAKTMLTGRL